MAVPRLSFLQHVSIERRHLKYTGRNLIWPNPVFPRKGPTLAMNRLQEVFLQRQTNWKCYCGICPEAERWPKNRPRLLGLYVYLQWLTGVRVGLPRCSNGKESTCQGRRWKRSGFNPWSGRSPGIGNGDPLQYSCLEKFHTQRSLLGYSPPWGHRVRHTEARVADEECDVLPGSGFKVKQVSHSFRG